MNTYKLLPLLMLIGCADITEDEIITAENMKRIGVPGVFIDSEVAGVEYQTSSGLGGITDEKGQFYYQEGDSVNFSIGNIDLGTTKAAAKLTPVEVMNADGSADNKVVNLTRLLQTLDADGDPSNGISISSNTKEKLKYKSVNFNVSVDAFEAEAAVVTSTVGKTMVSATDAMEHFHSTLASQGMTEIMSSDDDMKALSNELATFDSEKEEDDTTQNEEDDIEHVIPDVLLSASTDNGKEANETEITITATLSETTTQDVTVYLKYQGSATMDSDYSVSASSITVPSSNLYASITLMIIDDEEDDGNGNEDILIEIDNVTNGVKDSSNEEIKINVVDNDNGNGKGKK